MFKRFNLFDYFHDEINNFLLSQERMLGLCQNVEIIHQHHHHFYEIVFTPKSRNRSVLSKSYNPESIIPPPPPSHPQTQSHQQQRSFTSRFYHTKRTYLTGNQRGIEVTTRRTNSSFQFDKINLQQPSKPNQQNKSHLRQGYLPFHRPQNIQRPSPFLQPTGSHLKDTGEVIQGDFGKNSDINKTGMQKINKSLNNSMQKSIPTVQMYLASHNPSAKTKKNYFNCHQLKQSKMGFHDTSFIDTKKKREACLKTEDNISLSIPVEANKTKTYYHQNSQICIRTHKQDQDSILTKKEHQILSAFKTEKMFDDAKSIVSLQSLQSSRMNIDESIIISRAMDYFSYITPEKYFPYCSLYLARDNSINWIVTIKQFPFKHEEISLKEAKIYAHLSHLPKNQQENLPVLLLYMMMVEGTGLQRSIFFILEPFQMLLDQYLAIKKSYFKYVPASFNYFLQDFAQQLFQTLEKLSEHKIRLIEPLHIRDFVIVNGRFKLHSVSKFELMNPSHTISRESIFMAVQSLKGLIIEAVRFI